MSRPGRRGLLTLALAATLLAAWFAPPMHEEEVVPAPRVQDAAAPLAGRELTPPIQHLREAAAGRTQVLAIRGRDAGEEADLGDLRVFAVPPWGREAAKNRSEAAAPSGAPAKAPAPRAPPLPFQVLGRYDDAGQALVFLQHHEENLVVRVGDTIAGAYRVEALRGRTLALRYLPLGELQTLDVGGQ